MRPTRPHAAELQRTKLRQAIAVLVGLITILAIIGTVLAAAYLVVQPTPAR